MRFGAFSDDFLRRPLDYINSPTGTKIAAVAQPGSLYGSF